MSLRRGFDAAVLRDQETGISLDMSCAPAIPGPVRAMLEPALQAMQALEAGAIANPDEGRMVGHYWLRAPELAPTAQLRQDIEDMQAAVEALALDGHTDVLLVGIGGSALGPQLVADALAGPADPARLHLLDNTDPDGMARVLGRLDPARTLTLIVSKSGGTAETHNGMLAARAAYAAAGVPFEPHAIAITSAGSALDQRARGWRARVPMWDWVGGRFSVTSAVGLVPMALCGWDWRAFLDGAAAADRLTRQPAESNPAALLAALWFVAGAGRGDRALVIEPYKDRFLLLSRHLQQLVMESVGKALDRQGRAVHQGLTVYGNKGSTDQHAMMQQVRDGRDDCFVHFIETLSHGPPTPIDDGRDASDTLLSLMLGTQRALAEAGRPSLRICVPDASARSLGMLIALFERAVGLYAELIDVNAYHQPGVEAGKRAAKDALSVLARLEARLDEQPRSAEDLAGDTDPLLAWRLLTHLASTDRASLIRGDRPSEDRFSRSGNSFHVGGG